MTETLTPDRSPAAAPAATPVADALAARGTRPAQPIRLHQFPLSGHCHRVALFMSLLGLPVETIHVNLPEREHKAAPYLALNPRGLVPTIEDGATVVHDSLAILVYLAQRYAPQWLPPTPERAAEQQRWFALAAGEMSYSVGAARLNRVFGLPLDLAATQQRAHAFLAELDRHLTDRDWLMGDAVSLPDIAHYSYIVRAPEGGVMLEAYPHVVAWLHRVEALPGFVPMPEAA